LERPEDERQPAAEPVGPAEHGARRHPVAVVGHLDGLEAAVAELVDGAADADATRARPRRLLDHEAGDALGRAGRESYEPGAFAVRHPHLRTVDDVLVAVERGAAPQGLRVAPRVRLRERQAAAHLAGGEPWKQPRLLVGGRVTRA